MAKLGGKQMQRDAERLKVLMGVGSVTVSDEGVLQGAATNINITGAGASATVAGSIATINIPAGSAANGKVLLLHGATVTEYAENGAGAGLAAALAADAAGDTIILPSMTIGGNHTVQVNVTVLGRGSESILSGTITIGYTGGGATGRVENCTIGTVYYVSKTSTNTGGDLYLARGSSGEWGINYPPLAGYELTVQGEVRSIRSAAKQADTSFLSGTASGGKLTLDRSDATQKAWVEWLDESGARWEMGLFSDATDDRLRLISTKGGGTAAHYFSHDGSVSFSGAVSVGSMGTGFAHDLLSATHGDTLAAAVARGSLLVGNATPKWAAFAKGAANAVLTGDGTDTAWSSYMLVGTAGGTTSLAVSNTKTLTLTATDSFNLTIPATGTAALGTGAAGQAAYWSGTNALTYDNDQFVWDATNHRLGLGIAAPSYPLDVGKNQNANTQVRLQNTTNGTAAQARFLAEGPTANSIITFGYAPANYTGVALYANRGFIMTGADAAGLVLDDRSNSANAMIFAFVGVEKARLTPTGLGIGVTPAVTLHGMANTTTNNAVLEIARLEARVSTASTGGAAGFGPALDFYAESATDGNYRQVGRISAPWQTSTDVSRKGDMVFSAYDTAAREFLRGRASGTAPQVGFFGVTPVAQQTEMTDELTTITFTAPSTPDYAIQDLDLSGYGFKSKDEAQTVLSVIANLQTRVNELETKLTAYGLLVDAD